MSFLQNLTGVLTEGHAANDPTSSSTHRKTDCLPTWVRRLSAQMRTYSWLPFLLAAGLHVQAAVQIVPARIEEVRTLILVDDKVSRTPPTLKLTLSLSGPEAESAVRYGNLKLEEARDDKGTSLIPTNDTFHEAAKFKDYSNAFFRKSSFGGKSDPQVELDLAPSARQATSIAHLRGTLDLAEQGTVQTIELA